MIKPEYEKLVLEEGNEKEFTYKGFNCLIKRVRPDSAGHLCGYVEIPSNHLLYDKDYDEIESEYNYDLPSHCGLTYSGSMLGDERFFIGFDCGHYGDVSPCIPDGYPDFFTAYEGDTYKDMEYVQQTLTNMVDFIIEKEVTQNV